MSKRVIILAGGKGIRLRPYSFVLPKPLMPIYKESVLEILIKQLSFFGFKHITLAINNRADLFKALFSNQKKYGVKLDFSIEKKELDTIGPLKLLKNLPENFLVINGDILTDLNFKYFYNYHIKKKSLLTLCSHTIISKIDYGVIETNKDDILTNFKEKPNKKVEVSMGIYMLNKKIINNIPKNMKFGFHQLLGSMVKTNKDIHVYRSNKLWFDIGKAKDLSEATDYFLKYKKKFIRV
tara:strand:+ start:2108 stop:2821 length:714 start_codon:yes stop_codon:yes gene_type:complete